VLLFPVVQREDHEDASCCKRDPSEHIAGAPSERSDGAERQQGACDRAEQRAELLEPERGVRREAERKQLHAEHLLAAWRLAQVSMWAVLLQAIWFVSIFGLL
jgi:hypothetical protein